MKTYKLSYFNKKYRQIGFTITELMVAITLGIVLMAGISQIYLSSKQTYAMNDQLISFQENGRYITSRIAEEIRMAGHAGCVDTFERGMQFTNDFAADAASFYVSPIQPFEYSSTATPNPSLPTGQNSPATNALTPIAVGNSDILAIQYGHYAINEMLAPSMTSLTSSIAISSSNGLMPTISSGNMLLIADCQMASVFVAGNPSTSTLITHSALNKLYAQDTESGLWPTVMHFISNTYYVGVNNGINALYVRDNNTGVSTKIFDGIDSMDILYGVQDTTGTRYLDANGVVANNLTNNIFSTKITFNLRSTKMVDSANASQATKAYMTRQFATTIVLRNQGDW